MLEANISRIQPPLLADLDQIADDMVAHLKADLSMVSFTHNIQLVSLGLSNSVYRSRCERVHEASYMACGSVVKEDRTIRCADAGKDPKFRDLPLIQKLGVAGYMGVPIHNADLGAVGAVCVVTYAPRDWTDAEESYLRAIARMVEQMILKEMYRLETQDATEALNQYDQIISAFSMVRAAPTSIHDSQGNLVFANRAISAYIADCEMHGTPVLKTIMSPPLAVPARYRSRDGHVFEITRHLTSGEYLVCQWAPVNARMN